MSILNECVHTHDFYFTRSCDTECDGGEYNGLYVEGFKVSFVVESDFTTIFIDA